MWRTRNVYRNLQELKYHTQQQTQSRSFVNSKGTVGSSDFQTTESISSLSARISNCISQRNYRQALQFYAQSRLSGIHLLGVVPLLLKACASLSTITHGKSLHAESIKMGVESDVIVATSLISMYCKCGEILDARYVFDEMPTRNVVTWNAMIGGYIRNGDGNSASFLFDKMPTRSPITWIQMIDGFAKSGDTRTAREFFDKVPLELRNVVTWTVMVDGYASNREMEAAKDIFEKMPVRNYFAWSSMVSGYCKNGDVEAAKTLFNRIPERNLVNWNSLISGLAQNAFCEEALDMFGKLQNEGFEPDEVTLASALSACAQLGLLDAGKEIHKMIIHKRIKLNQFILNGLVDMYAKCGDLSNARLIFETMSQRNVSCWNAMISGFAIHGQCELALEFFGRMERSSESPNDITFLSVLSACAHGGYVHQGLETFFKMEKYGLSASTGHYGCLVDLLGRAGRVKQAYDLIKSMPVKPNDTVWGSLLGACRIHSEMGLANQVLKEAGGDSESHYVQMSNIYAASDNWEKAERMRRVGLQKGHQKMPGRSSFMVDDTGLSHFAASL